MASAIKTIRNFYRDSVALMQLSSNLGKLAGVRQASAVMASAANLSLLREAGLLTSEVDVGPNDLLIALEGDDEAALAAAEAEAEQALERKHASTTGDGPGRERPQEPRNGTDRHARRQFGPHFDVQAITPQPKPTRRSASASM